MRTKIALLIPNSYETFDREFAMNMFGVLSSFYMWDASNGGKYELQMYVGKEGYIDTLREGLAETAIENGAEYLLWCDSDQLFPVDLIEQMMGVFVTKEDAEAVAGLYTFKSPPFCAHVYSQYDAVEDKFDLAAGFPLDKLFTVEGAAFGCLCLKAEMFQKVSRPWFVFTNTCGEDLGFFRKFIKENQRPVKMYLHPGISCGHITRIVVDKNSYIKHNKIEVKENKMVFKEGMIDAIAKQQMALMGEKQTSKKNET